MRVAITGANGFVGAALCRYFHNSGYEVIALGKNDHPSPNLLKIAKYIQVDITKTMPEIDAEVCIHTAALSSDTDTYKDLILSNVEGTLNVVEAAKKCLFFIHISSSSVYQFKNDPVSEEQASIHNTLSDYGETRLLAEDIVELEIPENQKRLILRPKAIYGIGDRRLLPRLLSLVKGNYLLCPFKKTTQSSLTHVDNIGYAIELFLGQPNPAPLQVFNITDEKPYQLKELALECSSKVEKRNFKPLSLPKPLMDLYLFLNKKSLFANQMSKPLFNSLSKNAILDISKIKHDLKYKPSKNFHNSCDEITAWIDSFGSSKNYLKSLDNAPWSVEN